MATLHDRYPLLSLTEVRTLLARFLFIDDDVQKTVKVLSGGEKVRLTICLLMMEEPELLILDEPTNHLDLETKNIVEDVFENYEGPIIFISHDRYFINRVATRIVHMDKDGVCVYDGNYDEYKEYMAKKAEQSKTEKPQREKTVNTQAELRKLEKEIDTLHQQIDELKKSLFDEKVYSDGSEYNRVSAEITEKETLADQLFDKIVTLSGD